MTGIDVEGMNDKALEFLLGVQRLNREKQVEALANIDVLIARAEAEQSRRRLAAYWVANPTLTPVVVGDELLVTKEAFKSKQGFNLAIGTITTVMAIEVFDDGLEIRTEGDHGYWLWGYDEVLAMRRAYLASVGGQTR